MFPPPTTASAEGAQVNVPPFPATASAEGAQVNVLPSLWERVRVRGLVPGRAGLPRRHCVGAGSAATFTPALSRGESALCALLH